MLEENVGAVLLVGGPGGVGHEVAALEDGLAHLSVAEAAGHEARAQGVDGLDAHAVEAHAGGEDGCVVLGPRVELRNGVDQAAQGDAPAIVAHGGAQVVVDVHLDALAKAFVKLVDAVVDDLLDEDVDTVVGMRTVAHASDVHTGPEPDVFQRRKGFDCTAVVLYGCFLSHIP